MPLPVISKGDTLIIIEPLPEPAATHDSAERAMIAAAGLYSMMQHDPDMPPEILRRYDSLMAQSKSDLQAAVICIAQLASKEALS